MGKYKTEPLDLWHSHLFLEFDVMPSVGPFAIRARAFLERQRVEDGLF
jgi:hypothetical protein